MANIFISYSHNDQQHIIEEIISLLKKYDSQSNVFYDRHIPGGAEWREEIVNQIEGCDIFLYFLSPNSITSEYCLYEYDVAKLLAKRIIPLRIQMVNIESIPRELQNLQIIDMVPITSENVAQMLGAVGRYELEARYISEMRGQDTLFDVRRSHFAPEKEMLCEEIAMRVIRDLDEHPNQNIILILDAGSTIYPIFQLLCQLRMRTDPSAANRLKIITNNLPGASAIVRYGRVGERHAAKTVFDTRMLRGFVNVQYEASLSAHTATDLCAAVGEYLGLEYPATDIEWQQVAFNSEDVQTKYAELLGEKEDKKREEHYRSFVQALEKFCDSIEKFKDLINKQKRINTKVVSVITGNYVSIPDGPLARDKNHVQTKTTMIGLADETYVVAPLGKLLRDSYDQINIDNGTNNYETMYHSMPNWKRLRGRNVTLAYTLRPDEYFDKLKSPKLTTYFHSIQDRCEAGGFFYKRIPLRYDPSMYPLVSKRAIIHYRLELALREYEIPHETLRANVLERLGEEHS